MVFADVHMEGYNRSFHGQLYNISSSGAKIITTAEFPIDSHWDLVIDRLENTHFTKMMIVKWREEVENSDSFKSYGIQFFDQIGDSDLEAIVDQFKIVS
jgi:hypothetical protein